LHEAYLDRERSHRRKLGAGLLIVFVPVIVGFASTSILSSAASVDSPQPADAFFAQLDLGLTPATAVAAFSLVTALIVALQVAVRPGQSILDGDLTDAVARIRVFEDIALLTAYAAATVGVGTVIEVADSSGIRQPLLLIGPITLSAILVALATDAATASAARFGTDVRLVVQKERAADAHRQLAFFGHDDTFNSAAPSRTAVVWQLSASMLLASVSFSVLFLFSLWIGDGTQVLTAAFPVAALTLLAAALASMFRWIASAQRSRGHRARAWGIRLLSVIWHVYIALAVFVMSHNATSDVWQAAASTVSSILSCVGIAWLLTRPARPGKASQFSPGLLTALTIEGARRQVAEPMTP
jgi:hypothetical protein